MATATAATATATSVQAMIPSSCTIRAATPSTRRTTQCATMVPIPPTAAASCPAPPTTTTVTATTAIQTSSSPQYLTPTPSWPSTLGKIHICSSTTSHRAQPTTFLLFFVPTQIVPTRHSALFHFLLFIMYRIPSTSTILEPAPPISLMPHRPCVLSTAILMHSPMPTAAAPTTMPPALSPPPAPTTSTTPTSPTPPPVAATATANDATSSTAATPISRRPPLSAPPHAATSTGTSWNTSTPALHLSKSVSKSLQSLPLHWTNQKNRPQRVRQTKPLHPQLPSHARPHSTHQRRPRSRPDNPAF